jgi:hypothetical protein
VALDLSPAPRSLGNGTVLTRRTGWVWPRREAARIKTTHAAKHDPTPIRTGTPRWIPIPKQQTHTGMLSVPPSALRLGAGLLYMWDCGLSYACVRTHILERYRSFRSSYRMSARSLCIQSNDPEADPTRITPKPSGCPELPTTDQLLNQKARARHIQPDRKKPNRVHSADPK